MNKPIALDLCCGLGGGGKGLKAAGFFIVGVDIEAWPNEHNDAFILGDVRALVGSEIEAKYGKVSFIWASPPCQEFSYRSMPWGRKAVKEGRLGEPDRSIWQACERLAKELNCPIVIENVRGACDWMGRSKQNYGPYHLWGDVPVLKPIGNPVKGLNITKADTLRGTYRGGCEFSSKSPQRKAQSAKIAMIPFELSYWIGQCYYPEPPA